MSRIRFIFVVSFLASVANPVFRDEQSCDQCCSSLTDECQCCSDSASEKVLKLCHNICTGWFVVPVYRNARLRRAA